VSYPLEIASNRSLNRRQPRRSAADDLAHRAAALTEAHAGARSRPRS
jgi:hypothetical protein